MTDDALQAVSSMMAKKNISPNSLAKLPDPKVFIFACLDLGGTYIQNKVSTKYLMNHRLNEENKMQMEIMRMVIKVHFCYIH